MFASEGKRYLKRGRLSDVLALVQVLAYKENTKQSHENIKGLLRCGPLSAKTWIDVGTQHPEIFRVLEGEDHSSGKDNVALIRRLLLKNNDAENKSEILIQPLSSDEAHKLMELAVKMHDCEAQRRDRVRSVLIPIFVAFIVVIPTIIDSLIVDESKSPIDTLNILCQK